MVDKVLFILAALSLLAIVPIRAEEDAPCVEPEKCVHTEYRAYVKCIERTRIKRNAPCPFSQHQYLAPIVEPCYNGNCQQTQICTNGACVIQEPAYQTCQQEYNTCFSNCPTQECQSQCPYTCNPLVPDPEAEVIIVRQNLTAPGDYLVGKTETKLDQNTGSVSHQVSSAGHNITTVIRLINIVNNTNIVNVPTQINSTNINNINLSTNSSSREDRFLGQYGLGQSEKGDCCIAVQPRRCSGPLRCRNRRHRTCGSQCTSRVIHVQSRSRCAPHQTGNDCAPKVVYVPQPQPKCAYQVKWPYVSCGGAAQQQPSCGGCYDHYGYGFQNYHNVHFEQQQQRCSRCFDDGYDQGPLYRHGPFYRPGYYHQPPQMYYPPMSMPMPMYYPQMQYNPYPYQPPIYPPMQDCGYGCFGNEFIDPAFGGVPSNGNDYDMEYVDDDFPVLLSPHKNVNESLINSTTTEIRNGCEIIDINGVRRNCTKENLNSNPYLSSHTATNGRNHQYYYNAYNEKNIVIPWNPLVPDESDDKKDENAIDPVINNNNNPYARPFNTNGNAVRIPEQNNNPYVQEQQNGVPFNGYGEQYYDRNPSNINPYSNGGYGAGHPFTNGGYQQQYPPVYPRRNPHMQPQRRRVVQRPSYPVYDYDY